MSNRTQRLEEFEAIIAALNASACDEDGNATFRRLTRLPEDDARDLADDIIVRSLASNGVKFIAGSGDFVGAVGTALVVGLEIGHRLGLEEADRLPRLDNVAPEPKPRGPATYEGRRGALWMALDAVRDRRRWRR